jgi:hypothetical protein
VGREGMLKANAPVLRPNRCNFSTGQDGQLYLPHSVIRSANTFTVNFDVVKFFRPSCSSDKACIYPLPLFSHFRPAVTAR